MRYKTVKQLLRPLIVIFLSAASYNGQNVVEKTNDIAIIDSERKILLSDLRVLDTIGEKLNAPLAGAFAKVEIADAAWSIDSDWAKELLRKAYELSFPDEEERSKLRKRPTGASPVMPTLRERASGAIRNHVLEIASRDKAFAVQLAQLGATQLGKYEEHLRYASLAANSLGAGDKDAASSYLLQSIDADPIRIAAASVICNLAAQDR